MVDPALTPTLRFAAAADGAAGRDARVVVADTTWTPRLGDDRIAIRAVVDRVLGHRDPVEVASGLLDGWADEAGVVQATTLDGTSFWYYGRIRHRTWLQERLIWLWVVESLVDDIGPSAITCGVGIERELVEMAALVAAARDLPFSDESAEGWPTADAADPPAAGDESDRVEPGSGADVAHAAAAAHAAVAPAGSFRRLARGLKRRLRPSPEQRRRRAILDRLDDLAVEPGRLLVVLQHESQVVGSGGTAQAMNVYLDPIAARLRGTRLEPIAVDLADTGDTLRDDRPAWGGRLLPAGILRILGRPGDMSDERTAQIADRLAAGHVAVPVGGVDLGPALTDHIVGQLRWSLPRKVQGSRRIARLLERLRPAGIMLADEYHRQEWLAAAATLGIPVVAVQHGLIYRWHFGYVFPSRPQGLRLPGRLYVYGPWERRLLVEVSVFAPEEVRVGGSPRLDLTGDHAGSDAATTRAELGVAEGDRLVVVSGTWGHMYRAFHYPVGLARIFDRPMPRVHVLVKLHPGETDEGPYREVIEGAAAAGGFAPPPITIVRDVDLYRVLAAADAHLGFHSTVMTEAVVTGTRNLLADVAAGADLLGWVDAGVAVRVRDGADLLRALDDPATIPSEVARQAFLAEHFAAGDSSGLIASELLDWLPGSAPAPAP